MLFVANSCLRSLRRFERLAATQLAFFAPLRRSLRPFVARATVIATVARSESLYRKLVPLGALLRLRATRAVGLLPTRKRRYLIDTPVRVGATVSASAGSPTRSRTK